MLLPLRYMHSVVEMAHLADVEHTIKLLTAFAESVKTKDAFTIRLRCCASFMTKGSFATSADSG